MATNFDLMRVKSTRPNRTRKDKMRANGYEWNNPQPPIDPPEYGSYSEDDYTRYTITIDVTLNTLEYDVETYVESLIKEKLTDDDLGEVLNSIKFEEVK